MFSRYIRRLHADAQGNCQCVTCGVVKHWKQLHAGHYVDGRNNTVLFDDKLVHPQCFHCNSKRPGCLAGNKIKYTVFMIERYGLSASDCDDLDNLKFKTKKMTEADYQEIIAKYQDALTGLDIRDQRAANERVVNEKSNGISNRRHT